MAHEQTFEKLQTVLDNVSEVKAKLDAYIATRTEDKATIASLRAEVDQLKTQVDDPATLERLDSLVGDLETSVQRAEDALDAASAPQV